VSFDRGNNHRIRIDFVRFLFRIFSLDVGEVERLEAIA
jgi:hypothetical protein